MKPSVRYQAPNMRGWLGRLDVPPEQCVFQIVRRLNLAGTDSENIKSPGFVLLGFACDEGVKRNYGRAGAKEGPKAFRAAFSSLARPCSEAFRIYDAGDVIVANDALEAGQAALAKRVCQCVSAGLIPIVIGGGHETAFGHYQGLLDAGDEADIGILNIDAHFDLRDPHSPHQPSSGTPFSQIAELCAAREKEFLYSVMGIQPAVNMPMLFERAEQLSVHYQLADQTELPTERKNFLQNALGRAPIHYLTLCLDAISAGEAPGVSAPQPFGLRANTVQDLVRSVARTGQVIALDIVELCPPQDIDNRTARLAAQLAWHFIHAYTGG